jgi:hypothetical protein
MNLGDKQDIDALLGRWPAPLPGGDDEHDEEKRWENRADATVRAAVESTRSGAVDDGLDALLGAPRLAPEPGESGAMFRSGEKKMAQDKEPGDSTAAPVSQTSPPPTERRRGSLKEIAVAARAASRPSQPGTPLPASTPYPLGERPPTSAGRPSRPPMPTPIPGSAPPRSLGRPVEAGKEDSGVVNLDAVRAAATPEQVAAAEKAKPGQVGLFEDDQTVESAVNPAEQPAPARPTSIAVVAARRNRTGPIAGAAIAVLGIAAAFAIMHRKPPAPQPNPVIVAHTAAPEAVKAAPSTAPEATAPQAKDTPPLDVAALPSTEPEGKPDPAKVPTTAGPGTAGTATASKEAPPDPRLTAPAPAKGAPTGKTGDLQDEMARAVGPINKSVEVAPTAEPASAGSRNQNIPEQPSQGSVQAAIGAVVGGAKACVADADDISRAMVTFSSEGKVTSVSVSGWAAAHGKTGCVQAALKAAKVGPFSKSSFSVPVPIRP